MDITNLTAIGLSRPQAQAYVAIIEHGDIKPPELAGQLGITRTNAYKLLDKLEELGLVRKLDEGKIVYQANNPVALSSLTAQYRAEATAREEAAKNVMHDLLARYHAHTDRPESSVFTGRSQVAEAYRRQLNLLEEVYFIHTRSDTTAMGFDAMHEIRTTPARSGLQRHAIMTAAQNDDRPTNWAAHARSNLNDIRWAANSDYTAPVEWSVTASSLLIVTHADEPHAVLIIDPVIAGAFLQIWQLLGALLEQQPSHRAMQLKN